VTNNDLHQAYYAANHFNKAQSRAVRRAFYALCTHIDHQLRVVIGTLREEGVLNDTIILFSSDHGDMLGNHGRWYKSVFYEYSANVPMILLGTKGDERVGVNQTSDRLVGLQDVMPTLCDLAGVPIPKSVDGISMVGEAQREYFYGEHGEGAGAYRMMRDEQFKLIYYPRGNRTQIFDMKNDPQEMYDLAADTEYSDVRARLTSRLIGEFYGGDEEWVRDGVLVGLEELEKEQSKATADRSLNVQRGSHWPPPQVARRSA
jgi:arylsulfatase A-like enzyme